jgi:hypothetical protein
MLNMVEYARIFAYRTDMNLIGRDGQTDGRDGRTDAQTTLLTPKGRNPFFGLFLKFGQAIVDVIFVYKNTSFW